MNMTTEFNQILTPTGFVSVPIQVRAFVVAAFDSSVRFLPSDL
jgi:hypothetical protein